MNKDEESLRDLNIRVGQAESNGDRKFFERHLAPTFAMSRADGTNETRETFLDYLTASSSRTTTRVSVSLLGPNRAAVTCLVDSGGEQFDNHRMFVRESSSSRWKMLSWANEKFGSSEARPPRSLTQMKPIPGVYGMESWSAWRNRPKKGGDKWDLTFTKHDSGGDCLKAPYSDINSYEELAEIIAFLAVMNKNLTLLFRGQTKDYALVPSLHRASWPAGAKDERKGRLRRELPKFWDSLADIEEKLVPILLHSGLPRYRHIEDPLLSYARWAVIQHYELWPTPMLDFSTSLRVAASFAFGPEKSSEGFLYVTGTRMLRSDLMPLRRKIGDDASERTEGVLALRLNSVCPPIARRPHLQQGTLLSLYPFDRAAALNPTGSDFEMRLFAKLKLVDLGNFWAQPGFPRHTNEALLPTRDPLRAALRKGLALPVIT